MARRYISLAIGHFGIGLTKFKNMSTHKTSLLQSHSAYVRRESTARYTEESVSWRPFVREMQQTLHDSGAEESDIE